MTPEEHDPSPECPCQSCCDHADTECNICVYCGINLRYEREVEEADARRE